MYDFCFTYPYAVLLSLGGLMGYFSKGSTASLGGGLGSGIVFFLLAHISLRRYHQGQLWKVGTALSLLMSLGLTTVMIQRYTITEKLFPAGITALICGSMSLFYLWSLFFGPQPKKKQSTD